MPVKETEWLKRAKNVRLLAMDVDGVLTAGEIILLESGEEIKLWSAKDRLGLALVRTQKIPLILAWITGRKSNSVLTNAKNLGVHHVVQHCMHKKKALAAILKTRRLSFEQTAFIGDDLIDLSALESVGLAACPADAVPEVKAVCHYVSPLGGGRGVARDVLELILKAQNKWDAVLNSFRA